MSDKYEIEKRLSQLESDVRQLRQLLKPQPMTDNVSVSEGDAHIAIVKDVLAQQLGNPEQKRKPGRPRNEATNRSD